MRWPKASTASRRPRSSGAAGPGETSTKWNLPPSNGSTGSTTEGFSNPSATSPRPSTKRSTIAVRMLQPSRLDSCKPVSGFPGAIHGEMISGDEHPHHVRERDGRPPLAASREFSKFGESDQLPEQEKARSPRGLRAEAADSIRYCRRARKSPAPPRRRPSNAIIGKDSVGTWLGGHAGICVEFAVVAATGNPPWVALATS